MFRSLVVRCSLVLSLFVSAAFIAKADDNVGIGTETPDSSAILDIVSQNKGLLVPRLSQVQRDAIVLPAKSLLIFNATANSFEYNRGTPQNPIWSGISSELAWNIGGNTGLTSLNFLGSLDSNALIFKTNATERMRLTADGKVGIGTANPRAALDLAGDLRLSQTTGASSLSFVNPAGTFASSFSSGEQLKDIKYRWPLIAPSQSQYLQSDSLGNLTWKSLIELPSGGTNINSTLIWNGTNWVTNPGVTINNNTVNIGGKNLQGFLNLYDGDTNYVDLRVQNLNNNRVYIIPEVGDTAYFVMTKGDQIIGGNKSFSSSVSLLGGTDLRWYEPTINGNNYVAFKAPALANDVTYTLPAADGSAGQVLSTNGSGAMSWVNANTGVSGSGITGKIAYWTSPTSLGSTSLLALDTVNNFLGIGISNPTSRLTVNNGNIAVTNNNGTAGEIRWYEPSSGGNNYISFKAPLLATDLNFTWPNSGGTNGQVLGTDGNGNLNWTNALTNTTGWSTGGNAGTSAATNFIGTTDNQPLVVRANNAEVMRFNANGNIGIGTQNPGQKLAVEGSLGILEGGNSPTFHTIFKGADQSADVNYTLPANQGAANTVLSNDGAGNLGWNTISALGGVGGTGTTGTLAFWSSTTNLSNSTLLSFNSTTNNLGIGTSNPGSRLEVSNGNLSLTNNNNIASELRWYEPSGAGNNYTAFRAQAQAANLTYTWPAASGSNGQFLSWNAGDTLSWTGVNTLAWALNGNSGTNPNSPNLNFLGTTDNQSMAFRTNNLERIRLRSDGGIVMGANTNLNNSYGKIQINDNSTSNNYAALGIVSGGVVGGANTVTMALQASKQTTSTTNVAGYFIASSGSNNYGVVVGNGGDVYLGQVDSLTPPALRNSILANGNPNRTYAHHLNLSGELVTSQQSGGFGPGNVGQILISQGSSSAPQWASPAQVLGNTVWAQGGNSIATEQGLGTTSNTALPIVTNGAERMRVTADGRVGIGTNAPAASAQTDIFSTSKGILIPRMSSAQRDAIASPAEGLMVFVTTSSEEGFWYHDATRWLPLSSSVSANSTVVVKRKSSDQSIANSTALQDDSDMGMTLGANQVYEIDGMVEFSSASVDPDAAFGFSNPSGATVNISYTATNGSPTSFTSGVNTGVTSSSVEVGAGQISVVHLHGIVEMGSSASDFRLKWAQNSSSINSTTLKKNSYLKFTRVQ